MIIDGDTSNASVKCRFYGAATIGTLFTAFMAAFNVRWARA